MNESEELRGKFDETTARTTGAKQVESDGEVLVKVSRVGALEHHRAVQLPLQTPPGLGARCTPPQLPFEAIEYIASKIARCGIKHVDITGGEPLLRPDFEQIVETASKQNLKIGVPFTNAALPDERVRDMFERYEQRPAFQLSFDDLGHHNRPRGIEGAEKQADAALRVLQKRGLPVSIAMCIRRENRDNLCNTARYLASLDVHALRVNAPQAFGSWKRYARDCALTRDEAWGVYRDLHPAVLCKRNADRYRARWPLPQSRMRGLRTLRSGTLA